MRAAIALRPCVRLAWSQALLGDCSVIPPHGRLSKVDRPVWSTWGRCPGRTPRRSPGRSRRRRQGNAILAKIRLEVKRALKDTSSTSDTLRYITNGTRLRSKGVIEPRRPAVLGRVRRRRGLWTLYQPARKHGTAPAPVELRVEPDGRVHDSGVVVRTVSVDDTVQLLTKTGDIVPNLTSIHGRIPRYTCIADSRVDVAALGVPKGSNFFAKGECPL